MRRFVLLLALAACVPEPVSELDPQRFTDVPCAPELESRCLGSDVHQVCREGLWYHEATCPADLVCNPDLGCVDCDPISLTSCDGDDVRRCGDDGLYGEVVQTCAPGQCVEGYCQRQDCPEGAELIYVVDNQRRLFSFDPRDDAFVFELLGTLNCSAGSSWPAWGGGAATPFSMSVDRAATAWILHTSGQIMWVPVDNVSACGTSSWTPGTEDFQLFGMGFVADPIDPSQETLYLAGGLAQNLIDRVPGRLGALNPQTGDFEVQGDLPPTKLGPELTGTGGGELWGYFPGLSGATVARMDAQTGQMQKSWPLPGLPGAARAWAFAHWGGRYYIFISFDHPLEGTLSQVHRFDPATGDVEVLLQDTGYRIVGAGVSTCAPVFAR